MWHKLKKQNKTFFFVFGSTENNWLGLGLEGWASQGAKPGCAAAHRAAALRSVPWDGAGLPLSERRSLEQTRRCCPDTLVYGLWEEKSLLPEVVASESLSIWQHRFLFCFVLCVWFCFLNN